MADPRGRTAFYAARPGGWRDWWTLLHPPYTAWHLGYVAIGAALAPHLDGVRLGATVLAFFLAMGIGAHALDELHGHPLQTRIPDRVLVAASAIGVLGAVALGIAGLSRVGDALIPFIVLGPVLVVAYNLELFGGRFHTDVWFAVAWGALPLLAAFFAAAEEVRWEGVVAALAAALISYAQRRLSTPVRLVRRGASELSSTARETLVRGPEDALRALAAGVVCLAIALVLVRTG